MKVMGPILCKASPSIWVNSFEMCCLIQLGDPTFQLNTVAWVLEWGLGHGPYAVASYEGSPRPLCCPVASNGTARPEFEF
jgi:hypothetical protein